MASSGKKSVHVKIIPILISFAVLGVLIFTGPARALILGLVVSGDFFNVGESITFNASINVPEGETLYIDHLEFKINGPHSVSCVFDFEGNIISGCEGVTIQKLFTMGFYGYGLTNTSLNYSIILSTLGYSGGVYSSEFKVFSVGGIYSEQSNNFAIKAIFPEIERCSIRAVDGQLELSGNNYEGSRNSLNFKIPLKNAVNGGGYLISQHDRNRISFDIYTKDVLDNTEQMLVVWISGKYRINMGPEIEEDAIIYLDKENNKLDIEGKNLTARNMYVSFITGC